MRERMITTKHLMVGLLVFIFLLTFCNESAKFDSVKIGNQVWMIKNLNIDLFRNGDRIPEAKTDEEWKKAGEEGNPAWCYYDNDSGNGEKYGKLYNWYAVNDPRGLAPKGWHVPSNEEWQVLSDHLGGWKVAGKELKSTSGWKKEPREDVDNPRVFKEIDGKGTNSSGFAALPSGSRTKDGIFYGVGSICLIQSSTEMAGSKNVIGFYLGFPSSDTTRQFTIEKTFGIPVRCIKD